jgi:hypothetical protein
MGSAVLEPALDSGFDLAAGCCEAFAAAGDDAMRARVAGIGRRGEAGFEGGLGFVVLLNLGECMEAWEVNEGIGTNFVSELAGEDCSIGMADSEGDEVSYVAEYSGTDRRGQLINVLVRQSEGEAILAGLGEDGGERFCGEVLELIHHEQEGHAFVFGAAAARHGRKLELRDEQGAEQIGLVVSHAAFGKVGDEDAAVVHREGDGDAVSDLPENVAEHRRLEQGPDLILDRRDGLPHEARVVVLELLFPKLLHKRVTYLLHDPAPVVGIDEHPVHSEQGGVVAVEEGRDARVWPCLWSCSPRVASGAGLWGLVLRAGWRLATSLRSVGLVTSVVLSGVSGGEIFVRRVTAAGCGAEDCAISERGCEGFEGI